MINCKSYSWTGLPNGMNQHCQIRYEKLAKVEAQFLPNNDIITYALGTRIVETMETKFCLSKIVCSKENCCRFTKHTRISMSEVIRKAECKNQIPISMNY